MVRLDETPDAVACAHAAEQAFDVAWARQTLAEALQRLRAECGRKGRADLWGIFECRILEPTLNETEPPPYEQLVERFGMVSPSQASNLLITAKRMFTRVLAEVVRDTVSEEAEVQAEIRDLARILAGSGG
jgi:hypothetical protein